MARPHKEGLDYFSHDTYLDDAIEGVFRRMGNDAYVVWFRFLERAYRRDDGILDLSNDWVKEDFANLCHIDVTRLSEIVTAFSAGQFWTFLDNKIQAHGVVKRLAEINKGRATDRARKQTERERKTGFSDGVTEFSSGVRLKESKGNQSKSKSVVHKPLFRDCQVMRLTEDDFERLVKLYPDALEYIHEMDNRILSKGYKFKDFVATFLAWKAKDARDKAVEGPQDYDWRKDLQLL